jgi:excisionase family DNA binding protein
MTTTNGADLSGALSPADFQRKFSIGQTKFYEELKTGRLNAVKCGRRVLIPLKEVDRWANSLEPYRPVCQRPFATA